MNKVNRLVLAKDILIQAPPSGISPSEIRRAFKARGVEINYRLLNRDLHEIGATRIAEGRYTYHPTPEEVERARKIIERAEGGQAE